MQCECHEGPACHMQVCLMLLLYDDMTKQRLLAWSPCKITSMLFIFGAFVRTPILMHNDSLSMSEFVCFLDHKVAQSRWPLQASHRLGVHYRLHMWCFYCPDTDHQILQGPTKVYLQERHTEVTTYICQWAYVNTLYNIRATKYVWDHSLKPQTSCTLARGLYVLLYFIFMKCWKNGADCMSCCILYL